jgi:hypothetical protein
VAEQDCWHSAGSLKSTFFSRSNEDRLLRFSEAQRDMRQALEACGIKSSDNLLRSARQHFDFDGVAEITEAGSPSSCVCLGVEVTDKNIGSGLRYTSQLSYDRSQVTEVAEGK